MKSFLAGLLLVLAALLTPLPAGANTQLTDQEARSLTSELGCTATVSLTRSDSYNGYYMPGAHAIVVFGNEDLNQDIARAILLHEIGHCIQFQNGESYDVPWREWDADEFAMRNAHRAGIAPDTNLNALRSFLRNRPPHEGMDEPHGSPAGRILFNEHQLRRLFPGFGIQGA